MTLVCGDLARLQLNAPSSRVLMARDEVDRLILMRMDLDRYEAQLIPDLQQQVLDLTRALKGLVAASGDTSRANQEQALDTARRVLQAGSPGSQVVRGSIR
jgi:hypothetical protein